MTKKSMIFVFLILSACFLGFIIILNSCTNKQEENETNQTDKITAETETEKKQESEENVLPENIKSKEPVSFDLYELKSDPDKSAIRVAGADEDAGGLFVATAPIESMEFCCPTWTNTTGAITISLYKWNSDYETTKKSSPAASEKYIDFPDNAWLKLECGVEAGEYLFVLSDGENTVGIWKSNTGNKNIISYIGGVLTEGAYMVRLNYKNTPYQMLGTPSGGMDLSFTATVPEKYIMPADHPVNLLDTYPDTYYAIDGLNRELPDKISAGERREDRFVGLFYWTWHYNFTTLQPVNVSEFLKDRRFAQNDYNYPEWPQNSQFFWNEPIFGYYDSRDEWVLRKHAEMLADAGVDVIIFDCTNGSLTWRPSYIKVLQTFAKAREDGVRTPQIAFILPFGPGNDTAVSLKQLYLDIYRTGKYQDLWFYWKGKPLIMAHPTSIKRSDGDIELEILDFFQFRPGQPLYYKGASTSGKYPTWDWLSLYPQRIAGTANTGTLGEQMAVGIAQNWANTPRTGPGSSDRGGLSAMNGKDIYGRTSTWNGSERVEDTRENAILYGANFAQQFEYAIEKDPEFIFITGWNEWVAGRYDYWPPHSPDPRGTYTVDNAFPDQFDDLHSRDIEPSAGILKDHYYYQMVSYIRRYKGIRGNLPEPTEKTINIETDSWESVKTIYRSYKNNTQPRSFNGYKGFFYENKTGRNDIVLSKAAHDKDYIYFMVECADNISPKTDKAWMRLFINIKGQDSESSWEGFNYIINRENPKEKAVIEKSSGGWNWTKIADINYKINGKQLSIAVPRSALGIDGVGSFTVRFKWNDNMQEDGNIMDFYNNGDTAPGGRFCYVYTYISK